MHVLAQSSKSSNRNRHIPANDPWRMAVTQTAENHWLMQVTSTKEGITGCKHLHSQHGPRSHNNKTSLQRCAHSQDYCGSFISYCFTAVFAGHGAEQETPAKRLETGCRHRDKPCRHSLSCRPRQKQQRAEKSCPIAKSTHLLHVGWQNRTLLTPPGHLRSSLSMLNLRKRRKSLVETGKLHQALDKARHHTSCAPHDADHAQRSQHCHACTTGNPQRRRFA